MMSDISLTNYAIFEYFLLVCFTKGGGGGGRLIMRCMSKGWENALLRYSMHFKNLELQNKKRNSYAKL